MTKKTKYRSLNKKEEEQAIIQMLEIILDKSVPFSGAHRHKQWEKGWGENLESGNMVPKYFGKYKVNRFKGRLVIGASKDYEQNMLYTLVDSLAKKYLANRSKVIEFGCGTGHNLWRIKAINPKAELLGADWTKSSNKMVEAQGFKSANFDFFNPPKIPKSKSNDGLGVYTVAALEQTGTNYNKFVKYLLKLNPGVVVHIEPIPELLDSTNLLDYLSIQYMSKRKYLKDYLTYLEELEKKGKIKIIEARRSGIGSFLIDGYSVVVWRPIYDKKAKK